MSDAQERAAPFVGRCLKEGFGSEGRWNEIRHETTALLAQLYLPPNLRAETAIQLEEQVVHHLYKLRRSIARERDSETEAPANLAQLAWYILALTQLINDGACQDEAAEPPSSPGTGCTSLLRSRADAILDELADTCSCVLKRGVQLGTWGDQRTLSQLLQATMLLYASLSAAGSGSQATGSVVGQSALGPFLGLLDTLPEPVAAREPYLTKHGLVDPWTLLCSSVVACKCGEALPPRAAEKIRNNVAGALRYWQDPFASTAACTIHWSILVSLLAAELQPAVRETETEDPRAAEQRVGDDPLLDKLCQVLSPDSFRTVCGVWRVNFAPGPSGTKISLSGAANRWRLVETLSTGVETYGWSKDEWKEHFDCAYKDLFTYLKQRGSPIHVILSGFSTSGKSTLSDLLSRSLPGVRILRRATTRDLLPEGEEAFFEQHNLSELANLARSGALVAGHELWGEYYAFLADDLTPAEAAPIMLYQVGWSVAAILELLKHFAQHRTGDPCEILVLNPGADVLEERLAGKRGRFDRPLEDDLCAAEEFYERIRQIRMPHTEVDTSRSEEAALLRALSCLERHYEPDTDSRAQPNKDGKDVVKADEGVDANGGQGGATRNEHPPQGSLVGVMLSTFWHIPRWRSLIAFFILATVTAFLVWSSLPERAQESLLEAMGWPQSGDS